MREQALQQPATLCGHGSSVDGNWCWLTVESSPSLPAQAVLVNPRVATERLLTSVHQLTLEQDLWATYTQTLRLAPDSPFLTDHARQLLDSSGLIREGTVVAADDVLASVLAVVTPVWGQPKPPANMERVRNESLATPPEWSGATVLGVEHLSRRQLGRPIPRGAQGKVRITLRLEHALSAGDVLLAEQSCLGAVADFKAHGPADVQVGAAIGNQLGISPGQLRRIRIAKAEALARWSVHARGTGPYSLITEKPLPKYAEPFTEQQIGWLRANGFEANLTEMLTLKCSDLGNRSRTVLATRGEGHLPLPAAPETLWTLKAYLMTAALDVQLMSRGTHVAMALRPMNDAERLACSAGEVRKPETINYRTYRAEKDGMFCERIFGAEDSLDRRRRFGHISLPEPVVPILWRTGSPSLLERLLGLPREQIESIVDCEAAVMKGHQSIRVVPLDQQAPPPAQLGETSLGTGAAAIRALLAAIPDADMPPALRGRTDSLIMQTVLLYPPELRPVVLLENGNFATADTNDLYRRLINRSNRLRKLKELNAPEAILVAERQELQRCADQCLGNMLLPQDRAERRESSEGRLSDVLQLITWAILGASKGTVDYAGSARAVPDDQLPREWMLIPERIWAELGLERSPAALVTRMGDPRGAFVALRARPHSDDVIRLSVAAFQALGCEEKDVPTCIVHRPLGAAACAEAERLISETPRAVDAAWPSQSPSWMQASDFEEIVEGIIEAALNGQPVELDSPRGLMLAGPGPVEWSAVSGPRLTQKDKVREIPRPPEDPATLLSGPDVQSRMLELVRRQQRRAVNISLREVSGTPEPADGSLGERPWLPSDFRWPVSFGRKVPFLAQIPLEAAREAGVLPIDVPPHSLLTVFWDQSWSEAGPADAPLCQIVPIDASLIPWNEDGTPCMDRATLPRSRSVLTPHLVDEYPSWTEMEDLFEIEIGEIDPKELKAFHRDQWPQFTAAHTGLKLGGWAAWVQGADSPDPLIVQIASDEDSNIMFGDMGSLYLNRSPDGNIWFLMQCY